MIEDSNKLRTEYEMLRYKVKFLEDQLKSLNKLTSTIGVSEDIDYEIRQYIHPSVKKITPPGAQLMDPNRFRKTSKRSVSIMNFYSKYIKPSEERKQYFPPPMQIGQMYSNMELNKKALEKQNKDMEQLKEKVSQFLVDQERPSTGNTNLPLVVSEVMPLSPLRPIAEELKRTKSPPRESITSSTLTRTSIKKTLRTGSNLKRAPSRKANL